MKEADGVELAMNEAPFQQLLLNLILNAVAASDPGKAVTITARRLRAAALKRWWLLGPAGCSSLDRVAATAASLPSQECAVIEVVDKGKGFPQLPRDPVFSPGASESSNRGLGLQVCRRLVAEVGGAIAIWSKPGVGSAVGVVIPIATSAAATARASTPDRAAA